ncbi:MAG: enoyl-CoA hydratase/isomerase family protein [Acidimicrobiia bacterium]|nr:enoyl-CoA hydratase/isomerase family protein [Acidimicrobiia bacterium]
MADLPPTKTLRFERDGQVGRLVLDRPEKLNSFTMEMWSELRSVGAALVEDRDLRALIVAGEGRAFSSGIDTSVFTGGSLDGDVSSRAETGARHDDPTVDGILRIQDAYTWLEEAPFATIAAVQGYALGAGLQIALACDLRIFARGAKVGLLEFKYGIMPDLGGTQRLPRLVGVGKAKEMIFTAARIDAEEAYRIGLCERLVDEADLDQEAAALAALVAAQPPLAVRGTKRAIDASGRLPIREGLVVEAESQAECLRSADMAEAITAFVEGRSAVYRAR